MSSPLKKGGRPAVVVWSVRLQAARSTEEDEENNEVETKRES